jgi:hypothetical protein
MSPVTRGRNDLWGGLLLVLGVALALTALAGVSLFRVMLTGFFVWLAVARKQGWAWIPAAIFGFKLVGDLFDGVSGSLFFPLMVIAGGVLVLSRDRLSRGATFGILALLAVAGFAAADRDAPPVPVLHPHRPIEAPAAPAEPEPDRLPELDGRRLVVIAHDTDIRLTRAAGRLGSVESEDGYQVSEEDGDVMVLPDGSDEMEIRVPAEADVEVRTAGGDVVAIVGGYGLDVETEDGNVEIEAGDRALIRAQTDEGEIESEGFEDTDPTAQFFASSGGTGLAIKVETESGDIDIKRRAA